MAAGVVFCACASTASVTETSARALCVSSISLRPSNASASTPPPRANRPSMPRASGEPVSRYSCQTTATCCIWVPVSETTWPASSRRKSRDRSATSLAAPADASSGTAGALIAGSVTAAADRAAPRFSARGRSRPKLGSDPGAGALHRAAIDPPFVRRKLGVRPFLPADVQLLAEEPELCQLQSGPGGEVSIMVPAIRHQCLVPRELAGDLLQLVERDVDRALDVGLGECFPCASVDQHDLGRCRLPLHPIDRALLLVLGPQLGREEVVVGPYVVGRERHGRLLVLQDAMDRRKVLDSSRRRR